jgi:phosphatidylglycerophosphate synthase
MRETDPSHHFWRFVERTHEKYDLDLDPRHYETFAERDLHMRDLVSVPNAISLAGYAMVLDGARDLSKVNNIHKIGLGRGLDLVDGLAARVLDQGSDMGAVVDVTLDKLGVLAIARAAWKQEALPKSFISYVLAKNTAHAALTVAAGIKHPHDSFRPPKSGKHAMFGDNLGGGLLLYAHAYEQESPELAKHKTLRRLGYATIAAGMVSESHALGTYIRRVVS